MAPSRQTIVALLTLDDVSVTFGRGTDSSHQAVCGVSFAVHAGEVVGLVGESGSGKTTLAYSVLGLTPPAPACTCSGRIMYAGKNLLAATAAELRHVRGKEIALCFQEAGMALNPVYRVGAQVAEAIGAHSPKIDPDEAWDRAVQVLGTVGIEDPASRAHAYPYELSGGMQQRVALAMALCCDPRLLIADEPTASVDTTVQAAMLHVLKRAQQDRAMAVLLITHDLAVVAALCQRVVVMVAGCVAEIADVHTLFERPAHPYTKELLACLQPTMGPRASVSCEHIASAIGCRYRTRCQHASMACSERPTARLAGRSHVVFCHHDAASPAGDA